MQPEFIVGIGGSAGALNAYKALLDALPPDTDMAFVIISHMNPTDICRAPAEPPIPTMNLGCTISMAYY